MTFRWKDYAHGNRHRTMTRDAVAFLRRFLLHILPCGFQRMRHDGVLANRVRQGKLRVCRALLQPPSGAPSLGLPAHVAPPAPEEPRGVCPACQCGRLVWVATLQRQPGLCALVLQL